MRLNTVSYNNLQVKPFSKFSHCSAHYLALLMTSWLYICASVQLDNINSPRCQCAVVIPALAVPTIPKVEESKVLGVTISRTFLVVQHINHLLVSCAHSLCALLIRPQYDRRRSTQYFSYNLTLGLSSSSAYSPKGGQLPPGSPVDCQIRYFRSPLILA